MQDLTPREPNFQARYVLRHAFEGGDECEATQAYRAGLAGRWAREAGALVLLTGWDIRDVRKAMAAGGSVFEPLPDRRRWWQRLWSN